MKPFDPTNDPPFIPGQNNNNNKNNVVTGLSSGLLTSTGGLFGATGLLLCPIVDTKSGLSVLSLMDSSNFDTEEDCIYDFPQENVELNYNLNNYKLILTYRNLGLSIVTFTLTTFREGLTTYKDNKATINIGKFYSKSKTITLGTKIPDKQIYTLSINIVNPGIRPQISFTRKANKGPISLISLVLYGYMDETGKI